MPMSFNGLPLLPLWRGLRFW